MYSDRLPFTLISSPRDVISSPSEEPSVNPTPFPWSILSVECGTIMPTALTLAVCIFDGKRDPRTPGSIVDSREDRPFHCAFANGP